MELVSGLIACDGWAVCAADNLVVKTLTSLTLVAPSLEWLTNDLGLGIVTLAHLEWDAGSAVAGIAILATTSLLSAGESSGWSNTWVNRGFVVTTKWTGESTWQLDFWVMAYNWMNDNISWCLWCVSWRAFGFFIWRDTFLVSVTLGSANTGWH